MQNQETQDGSSSELPSSDELSSASSSIVLLERRGAFRGVAWGEGAGRQNTFATGLRLGGLRIPLA